MRKKKRLDAIIPGGERGTSSTLGLCECDYGEKVMLAAEASVCLTGSCIIERSLPILLATSLVESIYYSNRPPHNESVTSTATSTSISSQNGSIVRVNLAYLLI